MPGKKLREFLDLHQVKYVTIVHSPAYTALDIAAVAHVPGRELAKTVMVLLDGALAMVVVPAAKKLQREQLAAATHARHAELATEEEFKYRFPDCEAGAMPPFGNLYGLPVYADEKLAEDKEIAFNAGSHRELVRLAWRDFAALVKPTMIRT
jgi:Ala-tRNA(Pro) deacylase